MKTFIIWQDYDGARIEEFEQQNEEFKERLKELNYNSDVNIVGIIIGEKTDINFTHSPEEIQKRHEKERATLLSQTKFVYQLTEEEKELLKKHNLI